MRGRVDVRGGRALTRGSVDALQRALRAELADLDARDLRRDLRAPRGVDFASNDYLGLASSTAFRDALRARLNAALDGERGTWAAPASRLLRGNTVAHRALEQRFAQLKNAEDALLFPSGYQANVGLLTALVRPHDRVLSDAQNHASLIDGLRLARCRNKVIVPHLDLDAWAEALARPHPEAAQDGRTFVLVESLYSMDGDRAPLAEIAALATRHDAHLLIDDAHATGLYGPRGAGLAAQPAIARSAAAVVSTCGKSLGLSGAFVTGSRTLVAYLVSRCRSFIFSTAPPPLHVA
ncbi:MAG: aminotransferase class I/II-fold pyridoxal phosphate-dependent enzyme, partial [Acidobacteriota bacterium]